MSWMPAGTIEIAKSRAAMLGRARSYFSARNVLEVITPALQPTTVTDPHIASFEVNHGGRRRYLHTSPEYCMKRLLAAGYPDIYQICNVFRDGEAGRLHLAEFTMIEWYRRDFNLQEIMRDAVGLIDGLIEDRNFADPEFLSYAEAFQQSLSVDPLTADSGLLAKLLNADSELRRSLGNATDAWLDLAMATRVAENFAADRLTVIYHYPASQAALAQLCPGDPRIADRFEVYFGQIELANGFVELTDADAQLQRFERDNQSRKAAGQSVIDIDNDLLDALRAGLPNSAGVALGLDRVLMINEAQSDIRDVTNFLPGGHDER
jgi:lysyl-tRNA synthetase class 2